MDDNDDNDAAAVPMPKCQFGAVERKKEIEYVPNAIQKAALVDPGKYCIYVIIYVLSMRYMLRSNLNWSGK